MPDFDLAHAPIDRTLKTVSPGAGRGRYFQAQARATIHDNMRTRRQRLGGARVKIHSLPPGLQPRKGWRKTYAKTYAKLAQPSINQRLSLASESVSLCRHASIFLDALIEYD